MKINSIRKLVKEILPKTPYFPVEQNGRIVWKSIRIVYASDVLAILEFSGKYLGRTNFVVNTGTHGDDYGETVAGEFKFVIEDYRSIESVPGIKASLHIVSKYAPPIYPSDVSCDIIDAWCNSANHDGYLEAEEEEKMPEPMTQEKPEPMTQEKPEAIAQENTVPMTEEKPEQMAQEKPEPTAQIKSD